MAAITGIAAPRSARRSSCTRGSARSSFGQRDRSVGATLAKHADIAEDVHAAEPPCAACHEHASKVTKWSRARCTTCHVSQATGHMEEDSRGPNGCADCHDPKEIKPTKKPAAPKKP